MAFASSTAVKAAQSQLLPLTPRQHRTQTLKMKLRRSAAAHFPSLSAHRPPHCLGALQPSASGGHQGSTPACGCVPTSPCGIFGRVRQWDRTTQLVVAARVLVALVTAAFLAALYRPLCWFLPGKLIWAGLVLYVLSLPWV